MKEAVTWNAALVVVFSLFCAAGGAQAQTLYVRASGNDGTDGLSPATALHSIRLAARRLTDTGGQIIVGPGVYPDHDISPETSTKKRQRLAALEFIADRDGSQTGDPAGPVLVDATGFQTGFLLYGESNVRIDGFYVRGGSDAGIQVRYNRGSQIASTNVTISNCVVFSNGKRGIDVQDTAGAVIFNNLVYANGATGISIGGNILGSANAVVAMNTSYGHAAYGIFVGGFDEKSPLPSPNALVLSNILAANLSAGIKVHLESQPSYGSAFNVNADAYYPPEIMDPTDLQADPRLADPAGADGILGGTGFADDDFRLLPGSPALDYGPADVTTIGITGGTLVDGSPDVGTVDGGYHVGNSLSQFVVPTIPLAPFFVRTSGSDSNDGRTPDRALASIRYAASLARAGNRIVVGGGTYHERDINLQNRTGTAARGIEFFGDSDGVLTGDTGPVVVDATGGPTGFDILGSAYVTIDGFYVTGGSDSGIQIRARPITGGLRHRCEHISKAAGQPGDLCGADHSTVTNSVVFSNRSSGILVRDSANATIFNNLVYANGTAGIAVGGYVLGSPNATVVNNTVYSNGANGITIGNKVFNEKIGSPGALMMNNIVDQNSQRNHGIADVKHAALVTPLSFPDFIDAANLDGVLVGPIGFVNPAGPDQILGGTGFADDDFHLAQVSAGQAVTSIAVDRGAVTAAAVGVDQGSTRTDGAPDEGLADLGFHYGRGPAGRPTFKAVQPLTPGLTPVNPTRSLFVSTQGNDTNDGQAPGRAFRTIRFAARAAQPGDMVVVAPGRYEEGDINLNNPGKALQAIVFFADNTGSQSGVAPGPVLIDAGGLYDTGFVLLNRKFIEIRGFHITGARQAGIQVRACAGVGRNCRSDAGSDHVTIADNAIFSGRRGIDVRDSIDTTIFNNLIYANASTAIDVTGGARAASGTQIINNTIYQNGLDGISLFGRVRLVCTGPYPDAGCPGRFGTQGAPNAEIVNNLITGNGRFGVRINAASASGTVVSHNINQDGTKIMAPGYVAPDLSNSSVDPVFIQPAGADGILGGTGFADDNFRLDVKRSPAIGAGNLNASDLLLSAEVARSDGQTDVGPVSLGFHYAIPGPLPATAPALTLYVRAAAGDDVNDGQTPGTAFKTIARASTQAGAGTTVVIGPGLYREGNLMPFGDGTATNPIVFSGDSSGTTTGDVPGAVLIDAGGNNTAFRLLGKSYVHVKGIDVRGAQFAGILVLNASATEISNCRLFSNAGVGSMIVGPRDGTTMFNNLIYANGGDGLQVRLRRAVAGAVRLVNNTIYANGGRGVWILSSQPGNHQPSMLVAQNVIQQNGSASAASDLEVVPHVWDTFQLLPNVLSVPATGTTGASGLLVLPPVYAAPAGPDGVLGGAGFADDDFHVDADSSIIDLGVGSAASWGLDGSTVRHDGVPDQGAVDLGYHYFP